MAERTFGRPEALLDVPTHYCPGCHHGIIHRLVAEVIDELKVIDRTIGVASVGCSALAYDYFNVDMVQAPHGRAPAVATGIKRVHPDGVGGFHLKPAEQDVGGGITAGDKGTQGSN